MGKRKRASDTKEGTTTTQNTQKKKKKSHHESDKQRSLSDYVRVRLWIIQLRDLNLNLEWKYQIESQ